MEFVKFVFKFSNNMLPRYFNNYFRSLETIHDHNTRQKAKKDFFHMLELNGVKICYNIEVLIYGKMFLWK